MRKTASSIKRGWIPDKLSQELGSLFLGTKTTAWLLDAEKTAELPFFSNVVVRSDYGAESWFEHKNYFQYAIEIPLEGSLRVRQRETERIVRPGTVYIIHRGEDSYMESGPEGFCRKMSLLLNGYLLDAFMSRSGLFDCLEIKISDFDALLQSVLKIERLLNSKDRSQIPVVCGETLSFLMLLAKEVERSKPANLLKALRIMEANLSRPVSIARIAKELSTSSASLDRLFGRCLNCSPKQQYMDMRMEKAAVQLANSSKPVKEIAAESGFKSPIYFAAEFKRRYSCTPRKFRKEACGKSYSL